jgi:hypothetical protein
MTERRATVGRVIRRYRTLIPVTAFDKWQSVIRNEARGCGLYALYSGKKQLVYVGLATNSIRSRIKRHIAKGDIRFSHFSVFLVTGRNSEAQRTRIRDLEALLLNVLKQKPRWNKFATHFVGAKVLQTSVP